MFDNDFSRRRMTRQLTKLIALLLVTLAVASPSFAQTFPTKAIRVIVGFPPGTPVDITGRALAEHMQKQLGQPVIIEVRPGAGGFIAVSAVINAEPDGHTIHYGLLSGLIPALVKNTPVDARKVLTPISDSISAPYGMYVSAKLPVKSFQELLAYAKSNPPNTLNFASAAGTQELLMHAVKMKTGITYTVISYPGAPAVIPPLIKGDVGLSINVLGSFFPHLESGTVRALFITGPKRMARLPDVPTAVEAGMPELGSTTSDLGWWAPRGTPKEVIDRLSRATISAVRMQNVTDLLPRLGYDAVASSPEEQMRRYEANLKFWTDTARLTNFQPQ